MRIESKLCHISENKAIVQVNGWLKDEKLGSAFGEGLTVEIAEDNAISRLRKRLNILIINEEKPSLVIKKQSKDNLKSESINTIERESQILNHKADNLDKEPNVLIQESNVLNQEPIDWSKELIAIDSEIKRLKWSRDDEIKFLEKNLGYNNRNKITKYTEIVNYLSILKKIDNPIYSQTDPISRDTLIEQSDIILNELSWDHRKGREYLEKEFNVSTRKELKDSELISFVKKLKLIRNQFNT